MKLCSKCGLYERLPYHHYCRHCHCERQKRCYKEHPRSARESHKRRMQSLRDYIISLKDDKHCVDCGNPYPWYVLDYDHVRGEKSFNISIAKSKAYSKERVDAEIAKCDLVCANCHRIRTFKRRLPSSVIGNADGSEP
jgi:hypothetical protein